MVCWNASPRRRAIKGLIHTPSAQPERRRDLLHLGAILGLHSWRILLRENRLVLHFPIATAPPLQKTPPRAQIGFLVGQKQHRGLHRHFRARHGVPERSTSGAAKTRELTLPSSFFLLKKLPWRRYTTRAGGVMNMLLCAAVTVLRHTSVSGVLAFLLIGPISEKNKKKNV